MITNKDIIEIINTHSSNKVKTLLVKEIDGLEPVDAFIRIRGKVLICKSDDDSERTTALASLVGVSENDTIAKEDLATGIKYINKYWSEK